MISIMRRYRDGDEDGVGECGMVLNGVNVVAISGNYIFVKRMGTVNGIDF